MQPNIEERIDIEGARNRSLFVGLNLTMETGGKGQRAGKGLTEGYKQGLKRVPGFVSASPALFVGPDVAGQGKKAAGGSYTKPV